MIDLVKGCENLGVDVKEIKKGDCLGKYYLPFFDSHYIMKDGDILAIGSLKTIKSWIIRELKKSGE